MRTRIIVVLGIIVSFIFMGLAPPANAYESDLWRYYKLDESSGSSAYSINQSGTAVPTYSWMPTGGRFDGALDLQGNISNSYLDTNNVVLGSSTNGTVSLWIKADSFTASMSMLFCKSYSASNAQMYLGLGSGGVINFQICDYPTWYGIQSNSPITAGQWYNVTATWGTGGMHVYLNGQSGTTNAYTGHGSYGASYNFVFGAWKEQLSSPNYESFDGRMDDIGMWNRALSVYEVNTLANVSIEEFENSSTFNTSGTGGWSPAGNWGPNGEPNSSKNVYVNSGGTVNVGDAGEACNNLYLGYATGNSGTVVLNSGGELTVSGNVVNGTGTGTLNLDGGTLSVTGSTIDVDNFNVGYATAGSFTLESAKTLTATSESLGTYQTADSTMTQSGGTNAVTTLTLGRGTYNLTGGTLSIGTGNIVNGTGTSTLNVDGGAITGAYTSIAADNFNVGNATGATGAFELSSGKNLSTYAERVGNYGSGIFTQSGGTNIASDNLYIGLQAGSRGTYNLQSGYLHSGEVLSIGSAGTGLLNQTGGENTVSAISFGSNGTYTLSGGTLNAYDYVGSTSTGTLNIDGGTLTGSYSIIQVANFNVGNATGSNGSFTLLTNKTLAATTEYIGNYGTGTLTQSGGANYVTNLYMGYGSTAASGTYSLNGGTLTIGAGGVINGTGTGTLNIDGGALTGTYTAIGVDNFNVGYATRGTFTLAAGKTLTATNESVGNYQTTASIFTQTGGTNTVSGTLTMGQATYNLDGGTLNVANIANGTGGSTLEIDDGVINFTGTTIDVDAFNLGYTAGKSGSFTLASGQTLKGGSSGAYEYIGYSGTGTFAQSGGTNNANTLFVGYDNGSNGAYTQSGGTVSVTYTLYVGNNPGSSGTYLLSERGVLGATIELIGQSGTGAFTQSGGTNQAAKVYVGTLSKGTYTQSGGTTKVTSMLGIGENFMGRGTYSLSGTGVLDATGASEYIGNYGTGAFTQSGGTNQAAAIYLGSNTGAVGAYNLNGGTLSVGTGNIVDGYGTGTLNIDGGAITGDYTAIGVDNFNVGYATSKTGSFTLESGKALSATSVSLGRYGTGTLTLNGGTLTVGTEGIYDDGTVDMSGTLTVNSGAITGSYSTIAADYFNLGYATGSNAAFTLESGETLNTTTSFIGTYGTAVFTQTGGSNIGVGVFPQTQSNLNIGYRTGSSGTYNLSGGTLSMIFMNVGSSFGGYGTFNQSGGTFLTDALYVRNCGAYNMTSGSLTLLNGLTIYAADMVQDGDSTVYLGTQPGVLMLGRTAGATGTYELKNGTFNGNDIQIASMASCNGIFTQTGGTTINKNLYVGYVVGVRGTYEMSGPSVLSGGTQYVGYRGTGVFAQSDGVNEAAKLYVGYNTAGRGAYTQSGGTTKVTAELNIGYLSGSIGTYTYSGGVLTDGANNANMVVRNNANASGTFQGSGAVDLSGTLTNNGKVIADGGTLDMSSFASVTSTIENPTTSGVNGWFATDQGKLMLPKVAVAEGDHTYYWGENPLDADGKPDLVNSIKFDFTGIDQIDTDPMYLDVQLLAKDSPEAPEDLSAYDSMMLYKMENLGFNFTSVNLTFRFDDSFGYPESDLKLFHYHQGLWYLLPTTIYYSDRLIVANNVTSFSNFYGTGENGPNPTTIPEPVTVLSFIAGMAMLGFRRLIKRKK